MSALLLTAVLASSTWAAEPVVRQIPEQSDPERGRLALRVMVDERLRIKDLSVDVRGGAAQSHTWTPDLGDTDLVLHAPHGQASMVREVARGWAAHTPMDGVVTVTGIDAPLRGPDALLQALGRTLAKPLPRQPLGAVLSEPVAPAQRRIVITTQVADLPAVLTTQGLVHVIVVEPASFDRPTARDHLRESLLTGGGSLIVLDDIQDGPAALARLVLSEPIRARLDLVVCASSAGPELVLSPPVGDVIRAPLPEGLPPCPDAGASDVDEPPAAATPLPWGAIAGTAAGLVVMIAGGAWLLRRRPRPAPAPVPTTPTEEAEQPGRLLTAVDPDAPIRLTIVRGRGLVGGEIPLPTGSLSVGASSGNDAVVDLTGISGKHARFECFPTGDVFVRDADSANGTWVHGRRLDRSERARLRHGDRVSLGPSLELELVVHSPTGAST